MVDVFISYKREERARAKPIAKKLEALGLDVWFDARIPSGTPFDREIERALQNAKAVLVLWSPGSVESDWVRNEATIGKERGVLVALLLAACELPVAFRSIQYETLFSSQFRDDDVAWTKTIERIKGLVGSHREIDLKQRNILRRRKAFGVFGWLAFWPIGSFLIASAVAALMPASPVRPGIYGFAGEAWTNGYVYAAGSIDLDGDALPTNHVEISCRRDSGECIEARAELREGELSVFTDHREIILWDENVVVSRSTSPCADVTMTIDRALSTVNIVRQRRSRGENDPLCSWMNERNTYRLLDGAARANAAADRRFNLMALLTWSALGIWTLFVLLRIVLRLRR